MRHRSARGVAVLAVFAACTSGDVQIMPDVLGTEEGPSPLGAPILIAADVVATGLVSPVLLVQPPGTDPRRFVVDQAGTIHVLNPDGTVRAAPFLDLRARITPLQPAYDERGLLGLAFHPDFARNGRFYVFYTAPPRAGAPAGFDHTNVVAEFIEDRATGTVTAPERVILQVDHPQANHNGGSVAFGLDGYLYISLGDGGNENDVGPGHEEDWFPGNEGGNGQDVTHNLLGSILRIDVDHGDPYAIPADNPFADGPELGEIWAYGFRDPSRMSFDAGGDHMLLAGDAGQGQWEEVDRVVKKGNFGWNVREGTHCFDAAHPATAPARCPDVDRATRQMLRHPVIEFANVRSAGGGGPSLAVVGGYVYRGTALPGLRGSYVFGGFGSSATAPSGRLFAAGPQSLSLWTIHEVLIGGTQPLGSYVKGFGQDRDGEVYVMASQAVGPSGTTGRVLRLRAP